VDISLINILSFEVISSKDDLSQSEYQTGIMTSLQNPIWKTDFDDKIDIIL